MPTVDLLPALDPACRAITCQAVEWMLVRYGALPDAQQCLSTWPELPSLMAAEETLNAACLAGDAEQTKAAARAYCAAWLEAIKQRRKPQHPHRSNA